MVILLIAMWCIADVLPAAVTLTTQSIQATEPPPWSLPIRKAECAVPTVVFLVMEIPTPTHTINVAGDPIPKRIQQPDQTGALQEDQAVEAILLDLVIAAVILRFSKTVRGRLTLTREEVIFQVVVAAEAVAAVVAVLLEQDAEEINLRQPKILMV